MLKILSFISAVLLALPVASQTSPLTRLDTLDASRAWQAVGRINVGDSGFCTGTLIAPDLVLTAAHCVFDLDGRGLVNPGEVEFLAGWRAGRASATRRARHLVVHQNYVFKGLDNIDTVGSDIALIQLERPIQTSLITPFKPARERLTNHNLQVVSYAKNRADAPSLQRSCQVLARDPNIMVTSCHVEAGASGAPVFVIENGELRIISVVSAKAEWNARDVALMTGLDNRLDDLLAAVEPAQLAFARPLTGLGSSLRPQQRIARP